MSVSGDCGSTDESRGARAREGCRDRELSRRREQGLTWVCSGSSARRGRVLVAGHRRGESSPAGIPAHVFPLLRGAGGPTCHVALQPRKIRVHCAQFFAVDLT